MLVKEYRKIIDQCEKMGVNLDSLSISKAALFHLCRCLPEGANILELGGGLSTVFWHYLNKSRLNTVKVTTTFHDIQKMYRINEVVSSDPTIFLKLDVIKQISDDEWETLFNLKEKVTDYWKQTGEYIPLERYNDYTIRNAFYANLPAEPIKEKTFNALILDGPHGNGRSLAFPLLKRFITDDAYILIDDYHHYPFIQDAERLFNFEVIYKQAIGEQKWILIRLKNEAPEEEGINR
jgi:hypothetical protein